MTPLSLGMVYVTMGTGFACGGLIPYFENTTGGYNYAYLILIWPAFCFVTFGLCYIFSPEFGTYLIHKNSLFDTYIVSIAVTVWSLKVGIQKDLIFT